MQTKLTLRLDDSLIAAAKNHAHSSGKSLSQIVADYFARLSQHPITGKQPPITTSLRGILARGVDEEDYKEHLARKYLRE